MTSLSYSSSAVSSLLLLVLLLVSPLYGLPPELQNVTVPYPETLNTYVPYPDSALRILETEVHNVHKSITLIVTTSVTHWHNPVWHLLRGMVRRLRFQNQILFLRPYFYVTDGIEYKCRTIKVDETTGEETGMFLDQDDYCRSACTNKGRYCAPELPTDMGPTITGKMIVEETLRRLCFDQIYHAQESSFWDYLNAFEALECWKSHADMGECATKALGRVIPSAPNVIHQCMKESGGLEDDNENSKLKLQIDRQKHAGTTTTIGAIPPLLYIEGTEYRGPFRVDDMFHAICQIFDEADHMRPIACDFCGNCQDVRHCLWYLECNGTPFDPDTFTSSWWPRKEPEKTNPNNAPSSGTVTWQQPNAQGGEDNNSNDGALGADEIDDSKFQDTQRNNTADDDDESSFLYGGIVAGLIVGLVPALYFAQRANRTRSILESARATKAAEELEDGIFVDNLSISTGRGRPSPEELKDLDDVDMEINEIRSMMIQHGAPPRLAFLPKMT